MGLQRRVDLGLQRRVDLGLQRRVDLGLQRRVDLGLQRRVDLGLQRRVDLGLQRRVDLGLQRRVDLGLGTKLDKCRICLELQLISHKYFTHQISYPIFETDKSHYINNNCAIMFVVNTGVTIITCCHSNIGGQTCVCPYHHGLLKLRLLGLYPGSKNNAGIVQKTVGMI